MAIEYVAQNITFRRLILYCAQDFISKPCCIQKLVGLGSHAHTLCVDMTNMYVKLGHVFTSTMAARGIRQDMEGQQRKDYIVGFFISRVVVVLLYLSSHVLTPKSCSTIFMRLSNLTMRSNCVEKNPQHTVRPRLL